MCHQFQRFICFGLAIILCALSVGCSPSVSKPNQVLMILRERSQDMEFMLINEVNIMANMLKTAGFKVVTASVSGQPLSGGQTTLVPDMKLSDVKVDDYAGFIFPCMAVPDVDMEFPEAIEILKKANSLGKPVAAQLGSVPLLLNAGVLKGKQFALYGGAAYTFPDGIFAGEGVVQDGNIITSGICPRMAQITGKKDGTTELTQKLVDTLKSIH
jgi:putative intracellular protease/amidase